MESEKQATCLEVSNGLPTSSIPGHRLPVTYRPADMLVMLLLVSLPIGGNCLKIPVFELSDYDFQLSLSCIANITRQYLAESKSVLYTKHIMDSGIDVLLKNLHSMEIITFNKKGKSIKPNLGYMVSGTSVPEFLVYNISYLISETNWNPYARFLVMFKSLRTEELRTVFDVFLQYRVYNIVVLNGTSTAELYTYNPFENFACGRYYSRVIYYGKCSDITDNIYPNKIVTGLRNCFYDVSVPHWPPWGLDPSKMNGDPSIIGLDQYIFHLMSEIEQFKYKFHFDYDPEAFSTVSENLSISGPMIRLAENLTDVMLGGLMLIPSRASYFTFVNGYVDYLDEIRVIVKKAKQTPPWKDFYLGFTPTVWILLVLILLLYSVLVAILLKTKDKGHVILVLLDGLLTHSSRFRSRQSVKRVVLVWVLFAYWTNLFYTTSLMSLTTKPSMNYQISSEQAVMEHGLEPCINLVMGKYLLSEHNQGEILKNAEIGTKGCVKLIESVRTVTKSTRLFTIVLYSIYYVDRQQFYDEFGTHSVFSFTKPYAKVIYAFYFSKGFPMREKLHHLALRIREVGLTQKELKDQLYNLTLKYRFRSAEFTARFAIPWYLYITGLFVSTITFMVEIASQYNKGQITVVGK